jgi:hypothetical protein
MKSIFTPRLLETAEEFLANYKSLRRVMAELNIELTLPSVTDLEGGRLQALEDQLDAAVAIWINVGIVTQLAGEYWEAVVRSVQRGKNLLVTGPGSPPRIGWSDYEDSQKLEQLLDGSGIRYSVFKAFDPKNNWEHEYDVKFHRWNNCFHDTDLFDGVETVVVSVPRHLLLSDPASPLLTGNPTTRAVDDMDIDLRDEGQGIVCGARSETANTRTLVLAGWMFSEPGMTVGGAERPEIKSNLRFAANLLRSITEQVTH